MVVRYILTWKRELGFVFEKSKPFCYIFCYDLIDFSKTVQAYRYQQRLWLVCKCYPGSCFNL